MAVDTYTPRLKTEYVSEIRPRLKDELGVSSIMQVPRVEKITLNMGVGEAKTDAKQLDSAIEELTTIAESSCLASVFRSEEHTSELQSHSDLVCRLLLEKKKKKR